MQEIYFRKSNNRWWIYLV